MEFTQEDRDMLRDLHHVLLGVNGEPGLITECRNTFSDHYRLKRTVYGLLGFLAGSGALTGGYYIFTR